MPVQGFGSTLVGVLQQGSAVLAGVIGLLVLASLLGGSGCKGSSKTAANDDQDVPADSVATRSESPPDSVAVDSVAVDSMAADSASALPPDFQMVFGEGGGFTGQWTGYTLRRDGTVLAWQGGFAQENEEVIGRLSPEQMADLWHQIQTISYFEQDQQERGNVTAFMRVKTHETDHRVSWVPGVASFEPSRSPVEALYRETRTMARSAQRVLSPAERKDNQN